MGSSEIVFQFPLTPEHYRFSVLAFLAVRNRPVPAPLGHREQLFGEGCTVQYCTVLEYDRRALCCNIHSYEDPVWGITSGFQVLDAT